MKKNKLQKTIIPLLLRFGPCLVVMAAIFFFSSRTGDELSSWLPFFDKIFPGMQSFDWGHFFAYFALGLAFVWAVSNGTFTVWERLLAVLLCVLYGLTDEYHQQFVPGRSPDWHDIRNDGIGAILAMLLLSVPGARKLASRLKAAIKFRS
ncbi:VanZ family protein [Gorillibacterium timonense]|uniref:VanZ family protein n=1 Tax=Gorillibacterium timonense TaxID=1689269 RepID=UPI00071DCF07|nr:VanZ family protein [Gorillibacterium timonense]